MSTSEPVIEMTEEMKRLRARVRGEKGNQNKEFLWIILIIVLKTHFKSKCVLASVILSILFLSVEVFTISSDEEEEIEEEEDNRKEEEEKKEVIDKWRLSKRSTPELQELHKKLFSNFK